MNKLKTLVLVLISISIIFIPSCASKFSKARSIASQAGLRPGQLTTSNFRLQTFFRISKIGAPLKIYIEGDGLGWLTRTRPSANPTPKNPIALRLSTIDRSENIIYIARPCQYVNLQLEKLCGVPYWTHKRFAKEIVIAINEAINIMIKRAKAKQIHLIGYSGGGAVVAMIAAKRRDIASIRTIAGYMDHVALNQKMNVSPLVGSLDPIKAAPRLKSVPQTHYYGRHDKRVPGWVLENFSNAVGARNCISLRKVNASHDTGWEEVWERNWSKIPTCR